MCDTLAALPSCTKDKSLLFGKNSDRQRNEAQAVEYWPSTQFYEDGEQVCTYISIPRAKRRHAVLVCRPFWMWGAEMGANEHGVVIGNEGVHARNPASTLNALTGMDLVRLGLERAESALAAVGVISSLLEKYGQGGNCGHLTPSYYHNSFMIADFHDAFVLETVGRDWMFKRVDGIQAISNCYSIEQPDQVSTGMPRLFNTFSSETDCSPASYAGILGDREREHIGQAPARRARSISMLQTENGRIDIFSMFRALRDHGISEPKATAWNPQTTTTYGNCIHAAGEKHGAQTTGSMVSELFSNSSVHWVTGTAAPCISIFKPVLLSAPLPTQGATPNGDFDPKTLWWHHEQIHRNALGIGLPSFIADIQHERQALETRLRSLVSEVVRNGTLTEQARTISQCWGEAEAMESGWLSRLHGPAASAENDYAAAWSKLNKLAGIPVYFRTCNE